MRNLKKFLALVLAMMMAFSLMVTVNAASSSSTDPNVLYKDALAALQGMKVLEGYGDKDLHARDDITRGQMAAIIYRLLTGDNSGNSDDVAEKNFGHYATDNFPDTKGHWAVGYIGYCASGGIIEGYPDGTFQAERKITGYEVMTMLLRAIGYGKQSEFTGSNWTYYVYRYAVENHFYDNLGTMAAESVINRGQVAQLTFNAATKGDRVVWTDGLSYVPVGTWWGTAEAGGTHLINLADPKVIASEPWGIPTATRGYTFTIPGKSDKYGIDLDPMIEPYTKAVTECDIAHDLGIEKSSDVITFTNGVDNEGTDTIVATQVKDTLGAQGRWTAIYDIDFDGDPDVIVYIDTFLAQVTKVVPQKLDVQLHEINPDYMEVTVFDATETSLSSPVGSETTGYRILGNQYKVGDFILLNCVTNNATDKVVRVNGTYNKNNSKDLGAATPITGKQTTTWARTNSHIVGGTEYPDNNQYHLDVAQKVSTTVYTWFKDLYGNIIGSADYVVSTDYAILTELYWNLGRPGYAEADLLYMDGHKETKTVASMDGRAGDTNATGAFNGYTAVTWASNSFTPVAADGGAASVAFGSDVANAKVHVSADSINNGLFRGYALYAVTSNEDGSVNLGQTTYNNNVNITTNNTVLIDNTIRMNSNTVFVRKTITNGQINYVTYNGNSAVPTLTGVPVFYADYNRDGIADYVYIIGGAVTGLTGQHLVVSLGTTYADQLINTQGRYALRYAQIDGEDVAEGTVQAATDTELKKLFNNPGKLYAVTFSGGLVTSAVAVDVNGKDGSDKLTGDDTFMLHSDATYKTTYNNGTLIGYIKSSPVQRSWNLNTATVYNYSGVELDKIDWTEVNTYVQIDTTKGTESTNSDNLVAVYIYAKMDPIVEPPAQVEPGTDADHPVPETPKKEGRQNYIGALEDLGVSYGTIGNSLYISFSRSDMSKALETKPTGLLKHGDDLYAGVLLSGIPTSGFTVSNIGDYSVTYTKDGVNMGDTGAVKGTLEKDASGNWYEYISIAYKNGSSFSPKGVGYYVYTIKAEITGLSGADEAFNGWHVWTVILNVTA